MPKAVLLVHTNPVSDSREAEFNDWYDNTHIPEVLGVRGFVAATRYRLADAQLALGAHTHRYLAVYEIESDDLEATTAALMEAAAGGMFISDSLELQPFPTVALFEQTSPRKRRT